MHVEQDGREGVPDQVLVLPARAQTGDLEDKDAVVIEKVVYLTQESRIVTNTDMLHIPCEHQSEADERDERRRTSAISKLTILL